MRVEHLKGWLAAERKKEKEETTEKEDTAEGSRGGSLWNLQRHPTGRWWRTAFREGQLAEEAMWQAMVLIPKGEKD